jgi:hypothetical protein
MQVINSVGVLSVAKIIGLIYGCLGLMFVPLFLLIGLAGSIVGQQRTPFAGTLGVVFALFMPLLYGLMGFVMGAIGALLYNLFAKWVGGIELKMDLGQASPTMPHSIIPPISPASNL